MTRDRDRTPDEDFASRWSRRKRGAGAPATEPEPRAAPPAEDRRSDDEILRELGLPDPEALKPGDDIRGFMASAVPARIRNRVLRRLWISNPALANLDGLVDYGGDFTDAAMVPAVLQTAYKVGRGWARDAVEDEPEATSAGDESGAGDQQIDTAETDTAENESAEVDTAETDARGATADPAQEMEPHAAAGEERGADGAGQAGTAPVAAQPGGDADEASPRTGQAAGAAARGAAVRRMRFRFAGD